MEPDNRDDESLLSDIGAGGKVAVTAFNTLYDRWRAPCLRFLISHGLTRPDAEDAYQETMMRVARSAGTFGGTGTAKSWIWQIARNCHTDRLRVLIPIREREVSVGDDEFPTGFPTVSSQDPETVSTSEDPSPTDSGGKILADPERVRSAIPEEVPLPDDLTDQAAIQACVRKGMKEFQTVAPQRYLAILLSVQGWSTEDIAKAIGRTASATRVFLFECRKKVAPYVSPCWELSHG